MHTYNNHFVIEKLSATKFCGSAVVLASGLSSSPRRVRATMLGTHSPRGLPGRPRDEAIMRGRMAGRALRAHARSRTISLVVAAVAVPALIAGQSVAAAAATAAPAAQNAAQQPMTPGLAAQLSQNVNHHVIVIMKSQPAAAPVGSHAATVRSTMIASDQAPLMTEMRQVHATHVKPFRLVNSFAGTVSAGEEARLKANPSVAEVIPDETIRGPQPEQASAAAAS